MDSVVKMDMVIYSREKFDLTFSFTIINIAFIQIGMRFLLCRIDEVCKIMETVGQYQMIVIRIMIMLDFLGGANLLLAAFIGKVESRRF